MKKALLMLALTGLMTGTALANTGDDKDKAKSKKECCKKGEAKSCAGEKKESCAKGETKSCCKKKAEASTASTDVKTTEVKGN
jgi:SET domain-containing protein